MANLDTTSKRRSSVGLMLCSTLAPPLPDATIGAGDRQHIAVSYSGISSGAPVVVIDDVTADQFAQTMMQMHKHYFPQTNSQVGHRHHHFSFFPGLRPAGA